jgi:hypothetical protein
MSYHRLSSSYLKNCFLWKEKLEPHYLLLLFWCGRKELKFAYHGLIYAFYRVLSILSLNSIAVYSTVFSFSFTKNLPVKLFPMYLLGSGDQFGEGPPNAFSLQTYTSLSLSKRASIALDG